MLNLVFGSVIGFFVGFFFLRRSIYKTGCGQLKMCRESCPFFRDLTKDVKDRAEESDND